MPRPYSMLDDLKQALPEGLLVDLTDDDGLGAVNQSRVDEAVAKADGEIELYLGGRYGVPLPSVPAVIRQCSVAMAVYHLYARKVEEIPETRDQRYRDALRILRDIRDGRMGLPELEEDSSGFAVGTVTTSHFDEAGNADA